MAGARRRPRIERAVRIRVLTMYLPSGSSLMELIFSGLRSVLWLSVGANPSWRILMIGSNRSLNLV